MKRNFFTTCALAATLALASLPAWALQPFTAQYEASYKGIPASGSMSLSRQGARWTYSMNVGNSMATMTQATVFTEAGNRYIPLGSSDRSSYLMQRKSVATQYDWRALQARWTGDVKPTRAGPVKMQAGDMDGLLVNLALARDVAAGKPMNYRMLENGRARPMSYRMVGKEKLTVAGKPVLATKVTQTAGNKRTTAWIAPGVPVPVRIVQSEAGSEVFKLQLKSWR